MRRAPCDGDDRRTPARALVLSEQSNMRPNSAAWMQTKMDYRPKPRSGKLRGCRRCDQRCVLMLECWAMYAHRALATKRRVGRWTYSSPVVAARLRDPKKRIAKGTAPLISQ